VANGTRYALGLRLPSGDSWLALDARPAGPMRTRDRHRAHTWESAEALTEWLDQVPDEVLVKGQPVAGGRRWMLDVELFAVPLTVVAGVPIPLAGRAAPVLEGYRS
jgi:hypothetical protein